MGDTINYEQIADEIFNTSTDPEFVRHIVDKYAYEFGGTKSIFYIELMKVLTRNNKFRNRLRRNLNIRTISAGLDGKILDRNDESTEYEALLIIGKDGDDIDKIFSDLKEFNNYSGRRNSCEKYRYQLMKNEKIEIIFGTEYHYETSDFTCISINVQNGDGVVERQKLGIIEHFDFTPLTISYMEKYAIAAKYCNSVLEELNIQQKQIELKKSKPESEKQLIKKKTLLEIWKGSEAEYDKAIIFLKNVYIHGDGPFITEENKKLIWNRKISQKYLSGFICVCMEKGFIEDKYFAPELMSICKNTIEIDKLDKNNFTNILTLNLEEKKYKGNSRVKVNYTDPFLSLFPKKK